MLDDETTVAGWVHRYIVTRTWLVCAAEDAGAPLGEFEADSLLYCVAGSPLMPARPRTPAPPAPPAPDAWTGAAVTAWLDRLEPWVTAMRQRLAGRAPGLRHDASVIWTRRAGWAWGHYERGLGWATIAEGEAKRQPADPDRWRYVKDEAQRAVALACGSLDPHILLDGFRQLMAAYTGYTVPGTAEGVKSRPR